MNRNLRFVVGGLLIVGAIGYLMYTGIRETSLYYLTIQEFLPQRQALSDTGVRIAGRVQAGSILWDPRTLELGFHLGEFENGRNAGPFVPVAFTGTKPDMFAEGRDVIVEGKYSGGVLRADKVLTSCPSKYEAKVEAADKAAPSSSGQG